jgi:tRNA (cytidine/uridine-2'-O-)-methyltransferase
MNIVLVEPEIPQNAGNIARTCAATGTNLHMVKPLGFSVDDKYLKRAGLDYWDQVNIKYYESYKQLAEKHSDGVFFYATTKAVNSYADVLLYLERKRQGCQKKFYSIIKIDVLGFL